VGEERKPGKSELSSLYDGRKGRTKKKEERKERTSEKRET